MLDYLVYLGASAFTTNQVGEITTAATTAVGSLIDTFIALLPIIAVICGALFGVRFVKRTIFNRLD